MKSKPATPQKPTSPKPESLKIEGDWKNAVDKALSMKRPAEGWPKPKPKKKRG